MIIVIDFGSQFNQLIARRVRENDVYCQVEPAGISIDKLKALNPQGIILSGGPSSIYEDNSPSIDKSLFDLGIPILGICYGMHYMVHTLGGKIKKASKREYGFANLDIKERNPLFKDMGTGFQCWMSHGDSAIELPENFVITASTKNTSIAAIANHEKKLYGLQLHPEVEHSINGSRMIRHFLFDVCNCQKNWTMKSFCDGAVSQIKAVVGDKKVIMGLSG
ncbi:MAG: glutamine-hydrolyzing GMP synthase, partial [Desulfobacula sp.]|nr:glutamine-hydrolyzing GMP synthase [Desulfobacula sp.]